MTLGRFAASVLKGRREEERFERAHHQLAFDGHLLFSTFCRQNIFSLKLSKLGELYSGEAFGIVRDGEGKEGSLKER